MLNVSNQYDQQAPPPQNVLCSNQQTSSNSLNQLKAQNNIHSSQPNLNPNRSRNLNTQHQTSYPQQSHNQLFHNQASTSKQQFIPSVPINQQQIVSLN